jgi:hypothetical protein
MRPCVASEPVNVLVNDMNLDESLQGNAGLVSPSGPESPGADSRATRGRRHRRAASAYLFCERLTEATLCLAVVFNSWAFGTTQEWSVWAMNSAGYVLGGLLAMKWLVRRATGYCPARWPQSHRQSSSTGSRWLVRAMAVLTVLFSGYRTDPDTEWCAFLHNDWLESRITLGWIGLALLLTLLAGTFAHWFLGSGVPLPGRLAALVWLAMVGCLVHARFDFPFRVHSVATVFLLYCSVLSCSSRDQK